MQTNSAVQTIPWVFSGFVLAKTCCVIQVKAYVPGKILHIHDSSVETRSALVKDLALYVYQWQASNTCVLMDLHICITGGLARAKKSTTLPLAYRLSNNDIAIRGMTTVKCNLLILIHSLWYNTWNPCVCIVLNGVHVFMLTWNYLS